MSVKLHDGWYQLEVEPGHNLDGPGIIEWRVEGHGIDVGATKSIRARIGDFEKNLKDMLVGKPYHGDPNGEFRAVHHAIRDAYERRAAISLAVLETCAPEILSARKAHWLERRRSEEATGGPKVLNT